LLKDGHGKPTKGDQMSVSDKVTSQKPIIFNRLVGMPVKDFEVILEKLTPLWEKKILSAYKRPGRNFKLNLADMLMMLLIYYRSYITQVFLGYLFGIDDSRVCRLIKRLEPLLARVVAIRKDRHLSQKELENLIIDATEQPIERPKKGQGKYYSGKKKRHTLKTEIRVTPQGRIFHVSKSFPGCIHDFNVYKNGPPVHKDTRAFVDSGYQGLDKLHQATELPYKKSKNHELDKEEREYNVGLSRVRVKVENILCKIKNFHILCDRFRNKRKGYGIKFNIIAGIVNLKNGFSLT
jgi:hypothetical protein